MSNIDRAQKTLFFIFMLDALILVVSVVFDRSFHTADYAGYGGILVIGSLCLYTGYKQLSLMHKEGKKAIWYRQVWILVGLIIYITGFLLLISNI